MSDSLSVKQRFCIWLSLRSPSAPSFKVWQGKRFKSGYQAREERKGGHRPLEFSCLPHQDWRSSCWPLPWGRYQPFTSGSWPLVVLPLPNNNWTYRVLAMAQALLQVKLRHEQDFKQQLCSPGPLQTVHLRETDTKWANGYDDWENEKCYKGKKLQLFS